MFQMVPLKKIFGNSFFSKSSLFRVIVKTIFTYLRRVYACFMVNKTGLENILASTLQYHSTHFQWVTITDYNQIKPLYLVIESPQIVPLWWHNFYYGTTRPFLDIHDLAIYHWPWHMSSIEETVPVLLAIKLSWTLNIEMFSQYSFILVTDGLQGHLLHSWKIYQGNTRTRKYLGEHTDQIIDEPRRLLSPSEMKRVKGL